MYEYQSQSMALPTAQNLGVNVLVDCFRIVEQFPNQKIQAIKEVRRLTNLGLRESKDLVEGIMDGTVKLPDGIDPATVKQDDENLRKIQEQEFASLQNELAERAETVRQVRYDLRYYKSRKLETEKRLVELAAKLGKYENLKYSPIPSRK